MSLKPMFVKCSKCGKRYSFNPDVGRISCPNCGAVNRADTDENKKTKHGNEKY